MITAQDSASTIESDSPGHASSSLTNLLLELYTTYGPMVYRKCRKLLGDERAAMDAAETVIILAAERQTQRGEKSNASVLYECATEVCSGRVGVGKISR